MFLILLSGFSFGQNYALQYSGGDKYVSINSNFGLGTTSVTVECWVYLPTTSEHGFFVHVGDGVALSAGDGYGIGVGESGQINSTGGNELIVLYDWERWIGTGVNIGTGWHHVAFSIDANGNCTAYLDGVAVYTESGTGNAAPKTPSNVSYIAAGNATDRILSNGTIDEVRIWNYIVPPTTLRNNMYIELSSPPTNLVAYYKMSDGSGTTLTDNSTGGNSGTLVNTPAWVISGAMAGPKNALDFNTTNAHCNAVQNATNVTDNFTMMAWFKADVVPNFVLGNDWRCIAYNGTDAGGFGMGFRDGHFAALFGSAAWLDTSVPVSPNTWYHLALRRSGGTAQFFVNGKLLSYSNTTAPLTPISRFTIGNMYSTDNATLYTDSFDGQIDEVSVWDTALSDAQIRDYMGKSLTGNEAYLVAYYNFDNGSGTTLPDFTLTDNDLTLTNMNGNSDWVNSTAYNTWLNTNSSDWSIAANWSRGSTPSSTDNVGIYSYTGGTDVTINGSPTVDNFVLSSNANYTLSSGFTVTGNLVLNSDLDPNGNTISLSSTGTLVEGDGVFYGTSGTITTTRTLDGSETQVDEDVAGLGAHITTSANMGSTTIIRGHQAQGTQGIKRYYQINPTNNTGLNATLVFNYRDAELNGIPEADLMLFKSATGDSWTEQTSSVLNTTDNTLTLTGINDFSWWTGGKQGADASLPVELISFNAKAGDGSVTLKWATASEVDNQSFILERSEDNRHFEQLTEIRGHGSTSKETHYSFTDNSVFNGLTYFYRLGDRDINGVLTWYNSVNATPNASGIDFKNTALSIDKFALHTNYPNPFNPETTIRFDIPTDDGSLKHIKLNIYNAVGQLVTTLYEGQISGGQYELKWNGAHHPSGVYFLSFQSDRFAQVQKMILTK